MKRIIKVEEVLEAKLVHYVELGEGIDRSDVIEAVTDGLLSDVGPDRMIRTKLHNGDVIEFGKILHTETHLDYSHVDYVFGDPTEEETREAVKNHVVDELMTSIKETIVSEYEAGFDKGVQAIKDVIKV